jgi:PAS domain S-box-containing protein
MTNGKFGQILVVDDEVELKNALVQLLNELGYDALGCTSGTEVLKALRERNFDVLLSDLMMPEMDGVALLRTALEIDQNLICIIMTGQGTIQTAVDAMKVGAFDYILKPFRLQTLLPVLTRALNVRRLSQENLHLRETVAIYELCQTIAFTLDRQKLLSKLADAAMQQSEADELSILLLTADCSELYVAAVRGENRTRLLNERVPLEQGISSWVARERTPLLLEGQVNDARFTAMWPRADIRSAISVPLQVAGKLVGIINVNNVSSPRPFTLGQMKALTILASTAAAALESTALYERVRQAEQNYRSIFENAGEGIFQSTPEGRFITVNPSLARILGYDSPEEVIKTITDITHQLYVDPVRRAEATRLQEERGVLQGFEFEAYRKDGEKIWLSLNRRAVRDENGVEIYREGSIEDITERKQAEAMLRESEEKYRSIVETANEGIWLIDIEACTSYVNQQMASMLGYTVAEMLGRPIFDFIFPDDFAVAAQKVAQRQHGTSETDEFRLRRKDGSAIVTLYNATPTKNQAGEIVGFLSMNIDITERKRAEEELQEVARGREESLALLNTILSTAPIGFAFHNCDLVYERVNETLAAINGLSVEQHMGLTLRDVRPEMAELLEPLLRRVIETGEPVIDLEFSDDMPADPGRQQYWLLSFYPVRTQGGEMLGVGILVSEITERKRVEEQLRQQLDFTETITDSLGEGVYALDAGGRLTFMNSAAESALGWTEDELLGQKIHEIIHFQHADGTNSPAEECPLLGVLNSGKTIQIEGDVFTRRDGSLFPVSYNSSPIISGVQIAGAVLAFHDITERKRAEEELLQSEQRYRLLFERNPQPMWVFDLETLAFLEVNVAAIHHYGYSREEFLTLTIKDIRPQEDVPNLLANVSRITSQHEEASIWKHRKKDGTIIDVEITAHELTFYGRPAQMVLAYDVTERRVLEEQLRQSQKMEAVGQLAGGVAHDFNNLLTVITGYSDLTLRRLDNESPFRSSLEEIKKAGERAASLTRQLLAFSRKQVLQPKVLQLNAVVADVDKMLRRLIGEDIDALTLLEPSLGQIKADPGQIEQVILNLAVNARDAMPQGGKLTIETANVYLDNQYARRHTAIQPGHYVMLAVSDTGCGIDPETQVRMFEPFFTTKEQGKGTGLGLSTVYGIVKQSGGHLWVYSEVGKGTTFKIYLPRVDGGTESDEARDTPTELPQGRETVLLAEDEEPVRQMIRIILEMGGYRVLEASGGEEALTLYEQHEGQIDLIMTDVVMPGISGRELAQSLETLHPDIRVLYMSGYTDDAIVRHGLLDQEIAFLQKPFTPDALMRKVREVLDAPPKD